MSDPAPEVVFFPVRHHSPACAFALGRAFEEIRPRQVLVEGPIDFEPLLAHLTAPETKPPVAVISLPPEKERAGDDARSSYYPFCIHSPELVALRWARQNGARAAFIDLPARHPGMQRFHQPDEQAPAPLIADWRLDHNAYVSELCARRGAPDALALWDALFEAQGGGADWRGFFATVDTYCLHTRQVADPADLAADGTLTREAHMQARLAEAIARGEGPIAVVTGGFHTSALRDGLRQPLPALKAEKHAPANAYLIRYGFAQLDYAGGYGAGLPHPAFYDRLWHTLGDQGRADVAVDVLSGFAEHLRRRAPQAAIATPTLAAAILSASRLAELRDLPFPGRLEIIDAVRSTAVKEAAEAGNAVLTQLHAYLRGDAIGDLPPGAAQPPIVEAVRSEARGLGFTVEDGGRKTRDLDVLRRPRHARASRFLFALDLVGAGFASRIAGPDPLTGWRGDVLFETWTYAWSPMVESALIARIRDGVTLEALALAEITRRHAGLAEQGRARNAAAAVELLVAAVRTGMEALIETAAGWTEQAIAEDAEVASVIRALGITAAIARPGPGAPDLAARFKTLRVAAFDRLLLLFPDLAGTAADRLSDLIAALAELGALAAEDDEAVDREALSQALSQAMAARSPPALTGALLAFAGLIGAMDQDEVARRLAALLDGAYLAAGDAAAALTGALTVSPRLIVHSDALLAAADSFLSRANQDAFIASLPELRLAFSQLTPSEIDRVAGWAAQRHGLKARHLTESDLPAQEVAENLELNARLAGAWREDHLAGWLEAAP